MGSRQGKASLASRSGAKEKDCDRWATLVDLRAIGRELSSAENTFISRHAALCETCAAESRAWRDLLGFDASDLLTKDAADGLVERALVALGARTRTQD